MKLMSSVANVLHSRCVKRMAVKRQSVHRDVPRTAEQKAAERARRAAYQSTRPDLEALLQSGDFDAVRSQGELFELLELVSALKKVREASQLSLADVAERSGIDKSAISRLENGRGNPTFSTLLRLAGSVGKRIRFVLEDQPATVR